MERRGIQLLCNGDIAGVDAALGARVATALQGGGDADGVGVVQARNMEPVLRDALGRAAGHYLYHEKLRSKMICPVGNFHIRNGAIAWRLNVQGGDYTTRGGQSSYGECLCSFYLLYIVFFCFFFVFFCFFCFRYTGYPSPKSKFLGKGFVCFGILVYKGQV